MRISKASLNVLESVDGVVKNGLSKGRNTLHSLILITIVSLILQDLTLLQKGFPY